MSDFLSGLSVETAALPEKVAREKKIKDNPFTAWLSESYADRSGRSVTVPVANVREVQNLIRYAANDLNIGARVVVQDSRGNVLDKNKITELVEKGSTAKVKVLFQGQDKRKYSPRKPKNDGETAAE